MLLFAAGAAPDAARMSVMLDTTQGEIVLDLFVKKCPKACKNFLKLCKIK